MICLKCKENVPRNNYCGNCGAKLLEKCPECGKMEPIGRKVCETKLEEAEQARKEYLKSKVGHWRSLSSTLFSAFVTCLASTGILIGLVTYTSIVWQFTIGSLFLIIIIILIIYFICLPIIYMGDKKQKQAEQKALQKFLQENPGYAEILRKAEEK